MAIEIIDEGGSQFAFDTIKEMRIAMHSREYDAASQILAICQHSQSGLVAPIAKSAAKRMLYHMKAMYLLRTTR